VTEPREGLDSIGPLGRSVAAKIQELRTKRGMAYVDLGRRLTHAGRPIPVIGLRRIERLERRIDVDDLAAIADALGTTAARLLDPDGECRACHGAPPAGFACLSCGRAGPPP
jgi:transcriptional regulator with XRE-family HTH domain